MRRSVPALDERTGVTIRSQGAGPAVIALPMLLCPSQWDPVVDRLAADFTLIRLGGNQLGFVATLEARGTDPGYRRCVRAVIDELAIEPRQHILDVGCGTSVLDRWLAEHTAWQNPITATDLNPFFLAEARSLVNREGLDNIIELHQANAESLPFDDDSFDVVFSSTVMEECDADRMLDELVRVARPGGRIGVIVRAIDIMGTCSLDLPEALRRKAESPYPSVGKSGCADRSLYRRFSDRGLESCRFFPALMSVTDPDSPSWQYREPYVLSLMDEAERALWRAAKLEAAQRGTFLMSMGLHCAVGIKPG
jgi:ubiquinone/menaquinone biosynthesis C-methylase UbiE